MTFFLVFLLIGALLLLVIGINIIQQHKDRIARERRKELSLQRTILEETESILSNLAMLPCSNQIILVLYRRMNDALIAAVAVASDMQKREYERRQFDLVTQIDNLSKNAEVAPPLDDFHLPDNDRQVLLLVQSLKKLKAILRAENNKGKVDPNVFSQEEKRIDNLQLRINVDSMLSRARSAIGIKQYGSAKQMITKALTTLNTLKGQSPNDPFISNKAEEAKMLLHEAMDAQKQNSPMPAPKKKSDDDLDILFQQKKKW
ncbi:MAG: hypothetical protein LPD71_02160 [Shewanella sp.]|nr:hypothetical protein [Shewanella sp.]MCF1430155.1 hypothetical protein [Shewanella sp.]MCF1437582.1 hypothetical protein [Shewanella sp.]MCF1456233.1 hypothetical protein [Shewanella sp.]